ncbi:uncharacterized protein CMU_018960 [Cryptosporidium muris RN66]|uniref:Uncharacterized protein n=1 Tax=Cryptosporidium muris (strain RN66) TaxID=441375 RepID=B6AC83_CRYMR|nr:uncharacterized protein CMU_018960 [Cryptosporidium muris RN66]EEA06139.1 hypothetical protein, conserved [Cryptosporidium muris RN66]|eukprot:XP_002140488.1 hypothetical protein [Cryptosporidium muris RN66]
MSTKDVQISKQKGDSIVLVGNVPSGIKQRLYKASILPDPHPISLSSRKTILDEDSYISTLDHIIRRDFYPDLTYMRSASSGVYNVVDSAPGTLAINDPLYKIPDCNLTEFQNHNFVIKNNNKYIKVNPNMSLDDFHSRFTSQDNTSFKTIIANDKANLTASESWVEESSRNYNINRELKMIKVESNELEDCILSTRSEPRNTLMFTPHTEVSLNNNQLKSQGDINISNTRYHYLSNFALDNRLAIQSNEKIKQKNMSELVTFNDIVYSQDQLQMSQYLDNITFEIPDIPMNERITRQLISSSNKKKALTYKTKSETKFKIGSNTSSYSQSTAKSSKYLLRNSPLVKNVLEKAVRANELVDRQLREAYSGKRRGTISRTSIG